MTPNKPGVYKFKGIRYTASKKFIISIDDYVKVKTDSAYPELMVAHFGTGKLNPISNYEGVWAEEDVRE